MTTEGCPHRLYKYLAPNRVDALDRAMLRYTPLGAFNDPFEGRPEITSGINETFLEKIAEFIPQEAARAYEALPPEMRAVISLEHFMTIVSMTMTEKKPELEKQMLAFGPLIKDFLHQKLDEQIGAMCLSEVPDSLLMWSHYGASHTGYVLEFNSHHPYFHKKRSPADEFQHLRRVLYRETRPSARLNELEGPDLFLVKSGHWAYEREWRILRALTEAPEVVQAEPYPVHLFDFPRESLTSVILGARTTESTEASIRMALRSHTEYKHVKLKRASADDTHFLLRISPVTT